MDISTSWRINKYANSAQQKAAVAFLDWLMTSDKGQSYCADTFQFISALKGVKEPSGKLAQLVSGYVQSNKTIPWVYNTDFPNGIDADGASLMQQYYAGNISSSQLLTGITRAWVQDAQK